MRLFTSLVAVFVVTTTAIAQHGMIERGGLYNFPYHGDTWTGIVSSIDPSTRHLTLTSTAKEKTETFTGVLQDEGATLEDKDGNPIANKPITIGDKIMVFYV